MIRYSWPGNVRELQNLIEMIVVMKQEGSIEAGDLPDKIRFNRKKTEKFITGIEIPDEGLNLNHTVNQFEKDILQKALEKSGGVKNRAAKLLNLNRTTYVEKLKRYHMG